MTHIAKLLKDNFDYEPTESQKDLISGLSYFISNQEQKQAFLLKGYAGTGKTTIISSLVKTLDELNFKYILLAPTGRAAKVLSNYTRRPAFTIHKKSISKNLLRKVWAYLHLKRICIAIHFLLLMKPR